MTRQSIFLHIHARVDVPPPNTGPVPACCPYCMKRPWTSTPALEYSFCKQSLKFLPFFMHLVSTLPVIEAKVGCYFRLVRSLVVRRFVTHAAQLTIARLLHLILQILTLTGRSPGDHILFLGLAGHLGNQVVVEIQQVVHQNQEEERRSQGEGRLLEVHQHLVQGIPAVVLLQGNLLRVEIQIRREVVVRPHLLLALPIQLAIHDLLVWRFLFLPGELLVHLLVPIDRVGMLDLMVVVLQHCLTQYSSLV